ncbi:MAG: hypothetical protein GEV05_00020 [Betaproteobacteria bacterium]|nr:hypothetical protein [Betaproteobacteria bacterium]
MIVAADAVQPVTDLAEALLLERLAGEAAEAIRDVGDLARHGLILAQLEQVRVAGRRIRSVALALVDLRVGGRLHELVVHALD